MQDIDRAEFIDWLRQLTVYSIDSEGPYAYSGRGMYNKQCVGINLNSHDELWKLALACGNANFNNLPAPKTDSMGYGIVAYWPEIAWD